MGQADRRLRRLSVKYLLDTHTFLWSAFEPRKLSKAALAAIQESESDLLLSIASLWEIGILHSLGRIELKISIVEVAELADSELGATFIPIEPAHIDKVRILPFHHRDPFDRLLIAQASTLQASIIGKDDGFDAYGIPRVW
jgi:PIN domain nuclease of toxin-antitoxin system